MTILSNEIVLLAITFAVYFAAQRLQKKTGWILLNPILITIAALITFLKIFGISYETFHEGGRYIEFWLKPAIVALGVPLYEQLGQIKKQFLPIFASQMAGCLSGIISVVLIAHWFGAPHEIIVSLAPKSVTTPIAMDVCSMMGGIPSLTAAIVVVTGLLGAVFGFRIMELCRIRSPYSLGLGMGAASHAVGTSRAMERGTLYATYSSLGLILNGILTAAIAPSLVHLMGL